MKRRIVWLVVSCLMVVALLLASCAPSAPAEEAVAPEEEAVTEEVGAEEEVVAEEVVTPAPGEPQYGGQLTFAISSGEHFEPTREMWLAPVAGLTYQVLQLENWALGPSGTGELTFADRFIPYAGYDVGGLAESWDRVDLLTKVYHLREGIHWQNKAPLNGREFTADDVVFAFNRELEHPRSILYGKDIAVTALDKYTVEIKLAAPEEIWGRIAGHIAILPPEVIDAEGGVADWRNVAGTGPYIVTDYVADSSVTFERNPNYWRSDPFHPDNKLPYPDGATGLVITDTATAMAALRAGKIDQSTAVPWVQKQSLVLTNPELEYYALDSYDRQLWLRNDTGVFSDKRVRQALMYAIDFEGIIQDLWEGDSNYHVYPVKPAFGPKFYIPYEELPESVQELFEYHPDKARELLVEAGYPDGFQFEVQTLQENVDTLSVFKSYFEDIGVDMEIREVEAGTFWSMAIGKTGGDALGGSYGASDTFSYFQGFYQTGHVWNFTIMSDPYMDEGWAKISATFDLDEQSRIVKDLAAYALEQTFAIPIPEPYTFNFWQPWLKGYSGERMFGGDEAEWGIFENVWIDQDLKKEMGR